MIPSPQGPFGCALRNKTTDSSVCARYSKSGISCVPTCCYHFSIRLVSRPTRWGLLSHPIITNLSSTARMVLFLIQMYDPPLFWLHTVVVAFCRSSLTLRSIRIQLRAANRPPTHDPIFLRTIVQFPFPIGFHDIPRSRFLPSRTRG